MSELRLSVFQGSFGETFGYYAAMNNAIGLFLVFAILVAVVLVTNWQEKTGKKLSDYKWYNYGKWIVLGIIIFSVAVTVLLAMYGAAQL